MTFLQKVLLAGVCIFGLGHVAGDATAYDLSRGRQIILDRGLQLQANVMWSAADYAFHPNTWASANFTGADFLGWMGRRNILTQLPVGTQWGVWMEPTDYLLQNAPDWNSLQGRLGDFTDFQYSDEANITSQTSLDNMKYAFNLWRETYPNALTHTDLAGGGWNAAQLANFTQYCQPDVLLTDDYLGRYASKEEWYSRMQMYRTTALAGYHNDVTGKNSGPLPYGQYLTTYRTSYTAPVYDESFVRVQQFASWAFGFTYGTAFMYNDSTTNPGPVNPVFPSMFSTPGDEHPTSNFGYVAEANRQSRNLGPALVRLVSTEVRMIPATTGTHQEQYWESWDLLHLYPRHKTADDDLTLPDGISAWSRGTAQTGGYTDYITGITPLGKDNGASHIHSDVVIGYLAPLLANNSGTPRFVDGLNFMIVDGATGDGSGASAAAEAETYHITFDFSGSSFDSLLRLSRLTGQVERVPLTYMTGSEYYFDLTLDGGTGDLFRFWNNGWALPAVPEPGTLVMLASALSLGLFIGVQQQRRTGRFGTAECQHSCFHEAV